jgi:hypothetical protein
VQLVLRAIKRWKNMSRQYKREAVKEIRSIVNKAKTAMYKWIIDLGYEPTDGEVKAWQAGYLAGLNHKDN